MPRAVPTPCTLEKLKIAENGYVVDEATERSQVNKKHKGERCKPLQTRSRYIAPAAICHLLPSNNTIEQ